MRLLTRKKLIIPSELCAESWQFLSADMIAGANECGRRRLSGAKPYDNSSGIVIGSIGGGTQRAAFGRIDRNQASKSDDFRFGA
jgi:hypothetical protein